MDPSSKWKRPWETDDDETEGRESDVSGRPHWYRQLSPETRVPIHGLNEQTGSTLGSSPSRQRSHLFSGPGDSSRPSLPDRSPSSGPFKRARHQNEPTYDVVQSIPQAEPKDQAMTSNRSSHAYPPTLGPQDVFSASSTRSYDRPDELHPSPRAGHPYEFTWTQSPKSGSETAAAGPSTMPTASDRLPCNSCKIRIPLVQEVVSGLIELDVELRTSLTGEPSTRVAMPLNVSRFGLDRSLEWVSNKLHRHVELVRESLASRPSASGVQSRDHPQIASPTTHRPYDRPTAADTSEPESVEDIKRRETDSRRHSVVGESSPIAASPLRQPSYGSTMLASAMQAPPSSRTLPSPSLVNYPSPSITNTLPPISPSTQPPQSAQVAHIQDLQHQVSTKTLALQTLQLEHDNLLASYSRSQTRNKTLEKKCEMSESEMSNVSDERLRLQAQVDAFEAQVEELIRSRDEARKESVANGGQYLKIMSMASRLEAQGAADAKQWKTEKEAWEQERERLNLHIQRQERKSGDQAREASSDTKVTHEVQAASGLEEEARPFVPGPSTHGPTSTAGAGQTVSETERTSLPTSIAELQDSVTSLRQRCSIMEETLKEIRGESLALERTGTNLRDVGQRIARKAASAHISPGHDPEDGRQAADAGRPGPGQAEVQSEDTTMVEERTKQ